MRCPECGHENAAEMKFCSECGTRLTVLCQQCGARNAPAQKFCSADGDPKIPETVTVYGGAKRE